MLTRYLINIFLPERVENGGIFHGNFTHCGHLLMGSSARQQGIPASLTLSAAIFSTERRSPTLTAWLLRQSSTKFRPGYVEF